VADMPEIDGKYRLVSLDNLDGRTAAAKHAKSLIEAFENDLGGKDQLSTAESELVRRAPSYPQYWAITRLVGCSKARLSGACTHNADLDAPPNVRYWG
jgi:hypothetical protein